MRYTTKLSTPNLLFEACGKDVGNFRRSGPRSETHSGTASNLKSDSLRVLATRSAGGRLARRKTNDVLQPVD